MKKSEKIRQIIAEKVIDQIQPEHTSTAHFYRFPSGKLQPSVTSKLQLLSKPHLTRWAIKMAIEWLEVDDRWRYLASDVTRSSYIQGATEAHTDIRDEAGNVGTQAHNAIEDYIKAWLVTGKRPKEIKDFFPIVDGRFVADYRAVAAARAFSSLVDKYKIIPLASEILVGDEKVSAGTLDFLCLWDKKLTLVDFKSSNSIDQIGYSLQVSAYKYFLRKMTGLSIKQCKIIHLSKDSDRFTVYNVLRTWEAYRIFRHVCLVWDWVYNTKVDKIVKDVKKVTI